MSGKYIDFKSSWYAARRDATTFARWECGKISTQRAISDIMFNNRLFELDEEDFIKEARFLGYGV